MNILIKHTVYSRNSVFFVSYFHEKKIATWARFLILVCLLCFITGCHGFRPPGKFPGIGGMPGTRGVPGYVPNPGNIPDKSITVTTRTYGTISGAKGANVRKGPGSGNAVIGSLPPGAKITILDKQKNWYHINATINGASKEGWVHNSLVQASVPIPGAVPVDVVAKQEVTSTSNKPKQSDIVYMGYTKEFQPVKQLLAEGKLDELSARVNISSEGEQTGGSSFWKQDDEFLRDLETGTLLLDSNDNQQAVKRFSAAERINEERESSSKVGGFFQSAGGWTGEVFGFGAMDPYQGEGYEKVLMLNYLSIAYLLEGERKAYNVARRSIDWQNIEKREFDARQTLAKEKLQEEETDQSEVNESSNNAQSGISVVFNAMNSKAKDVPSAYVNPFGYYVTGMIQEYESYQDRSLRDNARISYQKALELNPESQVLQQAVKDLKKSMPPSGKRLLHVVVADGFVPEKKVLVYNFVSGGIKVPLKLPIYVPVASQVHRIEIQTSSGRRLAKLSPVADVEALCIRHQKDMEVIRNLRVTLAFSSTLVEKGLLSRLGKLGGWIGDQHDKYREPDTRSWMTLPETIQAARVFLPRNISKVKIVTFSRSGKKLASRTVKLSRDKPNFIYARSIDKTLYAYTAKNLWLAETN